ncbi:MAG: hypothetical protein IT233_10530 [Bacteroidia bacterium]|nr:hypothetical protein [Bacteroidia bacterium]
MLIINVLIIYTGPFSINGNMKEKGKIVELRKYEGINPRKEPLTVEKLKELMKDEKLTDEQAQEILFAIEALVSIIVEFQYQQELNEKNNQDNLKQAA